jgi:DNA invertase Pin-like site-specific DNA recombinase
MMIHLAAKREGWHLIRDLYDDGGFSGGTMERPAFQRLLSDVRAGHVDVVVVYKVDRLTRSLSDFAKIVEIFDEHGVSFVSVTQQFNTTSSIGRLTLNILLSFAQFEREVTGERAFGTRSRPPRRRASGWVASHRSVMTCGTASW